MAIADWLQYSHAEPMDGLLVLVWRSSNKKYTFARLHEFDDGHGKRKLWVTQHGGCFCVEPDDVWMDFIKYSKEKRYE